MPRFLSQGQQTFLLRGTVDARARYETMRRIVDRCNTAIIEMGEVFQSPHIPTAHKEFLRDRLYGLVARLDKDGSGWDGATVEDEPDRDIPEEADPFEGVG